LLFTFIKYKYIELINFYHFPFLLFNELNPSLITQLSFSNSNEEFIFKRKTCNKSIEHPFLPIVTGESFGVKQNLFIISLKSNIINLINNYIYLSRLTLNFHNILILNFLGFFYA
jgi:hypothetical protein